MSKIGLLVEGGGMKCAYGAGVLDVFLKENIEFPYVCGVSAGAANAASFVAKQYGRNKRFYTEHVNEPDYASMKNFVKKGNFFDLDYIYGTLSEKGGADELDFETLMSNPTELVFPATNAVTGQARFFTKNDLKADDFSPVKATSALPVICKPILIDGNYYYDGGIVASIPVRKMMEDGCDKIVAVMSKHRGYMMKPQGHKAVYTMWLRRNFPKTVELINRRHKQYNASMRKLLALQREKKALIYYVPDEIKVKTTTNDDRITTELYEAGFRDGEKNMDILRRFMEE